MIDFGNRVRASIHIGDVWVSDRPSVVKTVLGSCISVCLRDPNSLVGGMNHFMLPDGGDDDLSARYGVNAMELLINRCMKKGADRRRLVAKVFGGGHVLKTKVHHASVPQKNIQFAMSFLQEEGIPILKQDVGGLAARSVLFFTDSGRVFMKRLKATGADAQQVEEVGNQEIEVARSGSAADENVTLF